TTYAAAPSCSNTHGTSRSTAIHTSSPSTWATCATRSTVRSNGPRSKPCAPRDTAFAMIAFRRLPIRVRLTAGYAAAIAAIIAIFAVVVYVAMAAVLLDEIDTGLRSRAATIAGALPPAARLAAPTRGLIESDEAFAQVIGPDGSVLDASPSFTAPVLTTAE